MSLLNNTNEKTYSGNSSAQVREPETSGVPKVPKQKIIHPFKFASNRVWRAYRGGMIIDELQGKACPEDAHFPEEWVASCVKACNSNSVASEGISHVTLEDAEISFSSMLEKWPDELLGSAHVANYGRTPGFLAKLLDSAIRLPLQAHPDNIMAEKLYNSRFGKTEAWIVLATREINGEKPYLMLGFNRKLDKEIFLEESVEGKMPRSLSMLHKHEVQPGDVLIVRGGTVHAIGPGVLIYEIMEPTDLVTQPELFCGEQQLTDKERFGSIALEDALKVFDFSVSSRDEAWSRAFIPSQVMRDDDNATVTMLLDRNDVKFFGAVRLTLKKQWTYSNDEGTFCAGTVIDGSLRVVTDGNVLELLRGESFFMPYSVDTAEFAGQAKIILTFPPKI